MLKFSISKRDLQILKRLQIAKIELSGTYMTKYDLFCYFNASIITDKPV